jgi:hypothetical protein
VAIYGCTNIYKPVMRKISMHKMMTETTGEGGGVTPGSAIGGGLMMVIMTPTVNGITIQR